MTEGLVSEARPIPWERLSQFEKDLIQKEADIWIHAVVKDSGRETPPADAIDPERTGRVLFIDGPRGAGKTSLLLTLLKRWTDEEKRRPEEKGPCNANLHILRPVLDFDPLPRGMPLHGWLLEPWRKEAEKLDKEGGPGRHDSTDLTERLADLFERAVTGWTPAHVEGKGVIEKALAYQEQASGWLDTKQQWRAFIGAMLCQKSRCTKENCGQAHPFVYVVAIDDVDLQVEQLPQLLHAVRLLHHPNVAYLLTGNYEHLRFVLKLDYMNRHGRRLHPTHHDGLQSTNSLWTDIEKHSERLRDALIEKALPLHARITLKHVSFNDVLKFAAGKETVERTLHPPTLAALPTEARKLLIVTARQAQHAIDRHLAASGRAQKRPETEAVNGTVAEATLNLIADLCGTEVKHPIPDQEAQPAGRTDVKTEFAIRGKLTTRSGPVLKVLEGDQLQLVLTEQPRFVFRPDFDDTREPIDEEAHQALLVQLLVETMKPPVVAHALEWRPDEGILKTEVEWDPDSEQVPRTATFHWPRLVRLSASDVLDLGELSRRLNSSRLNSLSHLTEDTIVEWLLTNIKWQWDAIKRERERNARSLPASWKDADTLLENRPRTLKLFTDCLNPLLSNLGNSEDQQDQQVKTEAERWVRELYVMTAPYFGLPATVAKSLRKAFHECAPVRALLQGNKKLLEIQNTMVRNALIARTVNGRKSPPPGKDSLVSEKELTALTKRFLEQRGERSPDKSRWFPPNPRSPVAKRANATKAKP